LPTVPTRTRVYVLQHPHEQRHPFGTARFVKLCMPNAEVHVAHAGFDEVLACEFAVQPGTAVLYPHVDAADLADLAPQERPSGLLVLDGTWAHAKTLYRHNPWLQRLPHVRFTPDAPSRYRIRKEPRDDYVSTLEAIVAALRIVEPETPGGDDLLAAFDRMVDAQIAHVATAPRRARTRRERQRASRALPPELSAQNLWVAYAESSRPAEAGDVERELVQWVAVHVESGTVFDALLRPQHEGPTDGHLSHMGLTRAELASGETILEARARFAAATGQAPTFASWTPTSLQWGAALLPTGSPSCTLKTAWCNLHSRRAGYLEDLVAAAGLTPVPIACRGRARERLGNAVAMARHLRASAAQLG
jgi:hypothetical protein